MGYEYGWENEWKPAERRVLSAFWLSISLQGLHLSLWAQIWAFKVQGDHCEMKL